MQWVQLHGYPTPGAVRKVKAIGDDVRVIKVLHVRGGECVEASLISSYEKAGVDVFLFDVVTEDGRVGSTGQALDPAVVAPLIDRLTRPFLLAGGISDTNRAEYESLAGESAVPRRRRRYERPRRGRRDLTGKGRGDHAGLETRGHSCLVRFIDALLAGRLPIIMEVKRQDGEGAELMGERTIPEIVSQYVAVGAPCISVVTGRWFGGDDDDAHRGRRADRPAAAQEGLHHAREADRRRQGAGRLRGPAHREDPAREDLPAPDRARAAITGSPRSWRSSTRTELESVIHPEDCIIAVNNKDINTREREPGDIDTSRSLLEATIQTGTPCPVSASAITDPRIAAELVDCRLQGAPDRHRAAPRRQHPGWIEEFERHRAELTSPDNAAQPPSS